MASAGLHRVAAPRSVGGGECDPATQIETIEVISAADGASGWNLMIGIENQGFLGAALPLETARKLFADPALIVAGALKDHERATVVGLTSFGKGSVQTVIPLRQGQDGALSITTARYYTPSGASIQKIGIEPDYEVARSAAEARIVSRSSFIYSEAAYATALDASIGAERKGAHTPREAPGEDYPKDKDYQLERALDLLRAGGDLSKLSAPPEEIVVTEPGSEPRPDATSADQPETPEEP